MASIGRTVRVDVCEKVVPYGVAGLAPKGAISPYEQQPRSTRNYQWVSTLDTH